MASLRQHQHRSLDRDIWAMAWPVIATFLLANAVELVDIAMVGRLGQNAVAAVGYATQCAHLLRTLLFSVGTGCVALMARAIGAHQPERARQALAGSLLVSGCVALFGVTWGMTLPRQLLGLLNAEPGVIELSVPYFRLSLVAILLFSVSVVLESSQRAHRNMRTPLIVAGICAAVKIGLNLVLIFGALGFPRLELIGAGIATLVSELVALLLFGLAAAHGAREGRALWPKLEGFRALVENARAVLAVSLPAVAERFAMNLALLVYFAILAGYGTSAIAAYAVGVRLLAFSWLPGIGFGAAAATLVGQSLGAGNERAARRNGWRSMQLALAVMAILGVLCAFGREPLARFFTHDEAVIAQLLPFLLMLACAQPFMGVHFTLSGALRGAGDTMTPLLGATVGNWVLRIPLAWIMARVLHEPIIWAWAALVLDHVVRSVWYVLRFRGARWALAIGVAARRP